MLQKVDGHLDYAKTSMPFSKPHGGSMAADEYLVTQIYPHQSGNRDSTDIKSPTNYAQSARDSRVTLMECACAPLTGSNLKA
jgi:hypothetical protein